MECTAELTDIKPIVGNAQSAEYASRRIGLAVFNGFALPAAATIVEVFQAANALGRPGRAVLPAYDVCLVSAAGGRIASSSSVFVWTESLETCRQWDNFHALFIAGGMGVANALRDERLITWLRRAHPKSEIVHPLGEGRLLLEAAGLAQAASATESRLPVANGARRVLPNASDALDSLQTALSVVTEDFGEEVAHQISSWVAPPPPTHFSAVVRKNASVCVTEKIRESARWIEINGDRPISIDDAAQVAAMSERNFLRRFKTEIGVTPSDYLLYVRLDMSCRLLAETDLPIDKIARRCGVGSGGRLSKLFRKHLETTPSEYRTQHRSAKR
jgi:transcriptional regulator GlxA family with amidase domain